MHMSMHNPYLAIKSFGIRSSKRCIVRSIRKRRCLHIDVDLSDNIDTKYVKLGLKDMLSDNSTWKWDNDTVRKFYSTLFINSDRTEMTFMMNSKRCRATKKDLEEALCIKPVDGSIVLHDFTKWDKNELSCLYAKPNMMVTKKVHDFKPEVNLIQKINRCTLLPRIGNRGDCSDVLLRLTHAIYKETPFDVANFLLSEMCFVIEDPNHQLPYGPYIFSLLHHLKIINDESIGETCSLTAYNPLAMKKSEKSVIVQLKKEMESLVATFMKRMDELERKVEEFEKRIKDVETLLKGSSDIVFRRRGGN